MHALSSDAESNVPLAVRDYGIEPDFAQLSDAERSVCVGPCSQTHPQDRSSARGRELQSQIEAAHDEIRQLGPSAAAGSQLDALERELRTCERDMDSCRGFVREAREEFQVLKKQRYTRFHRAYSYISERIDGIYKELTKSKAAPMGGVAYLSLDNTDEPYNTGIRYHAMPPMKRFRDMDQRFGLTRAVPEPSVWSMLILGFGLVGAALRLGRRRRVAAASAA